MSNISAMRSYTTLTTEPLYWVSGETFRSVKRARDGPEQPKILASIGTNNASGSQVVRRTHSSLMDDLGVDPQVGRSRWDIRVDVNQNVYTGASFDRRLNAVNDVGRRRNVNGLKWTRALKKSLIEKLERETGVEPATSSLGKRLSIENKELCVFVNLFLAMNLVVFILIFRATLNGDQMVFTVRLEREARAAVDHPAVERRPSVDCPPSIDLTTWQQKRSQRV